MQEHEELNPEFLRQNLKLMADVTLSEQTEEKLGLFIGLVSMMKMLQPQGYRTSVPATVFHAIKE